MSWLRPSQQGWDNGDRDATCGIGAVRVSPSDVGSEAVLFEGDVRDVADQARDHPVGTCLDVDRLPVGCDRTHRHEVVGRLAYPDAPEAPDAAAVAVVDDQCAATAQAYMGGFVPSPWLHILEPISAESWAAGTRHVHCLVGQVGGDLDWVDVTGPAPRG